MIPGLLAIVVGAFGLLFCGCYLLRPLWNRYATQVDARLREIPRTTSSPTRSSQSAALLSGSQGAKSTNQWTTLLNRLVPNRDEDRRRHQLRLMHAGIYNPVALSWFFAVKLLLMVSPPVIGCLAGWWGLVDGRWGLLVGCITGGCGLILPAFWLHRRIRQRHVVLRRSLADFLDVMIVCLESGLSLPGAIQRVGDELRLAHPLLAGELGIVQREMELGASIDAALRHFADRSGYEGVRTLSTFVRESQRFGTELVEALRMHADMLRSQREQVVEEAAQKASVMILIPTLLLILPAVFVVLAGPALIQIHEAFSKK